jgi:hypothetical protein
MDFMNLRNASLRIASLKIKHLRIALVVCLALCGCGRSAPVAEIKSLPVTGKVTLDGEPLAGAAVIFVAGEPPSTFFATTQADGSYALQGREELAEKLQGNCKVTVSRMVKPDGSPLAEGEMPMDVQAVEQLPVKYSMLNSTELEADVTPAGGTYNFELTSK